MVMLAIRDDDPNALTPPGEIEESYAAVWDRVVVSFGVVPWIGWRYLLLRDHSEKLPSRAEKLSAIANVEAGNAPKQLMDYSAKFPAPMGIGDNRDLCEMLRQRMQRGTADVFLHGVHHDTYADGFEFESGKDLTAKVAKALAYLESIFGHRIRVFSPPNNSIGKDGVRAIASNRLNMVVGYGPWINERPVNSRAISAFARLGMHRIRAGKAIPFPFFLDYGDHLEHASMPFGPSTKLSTMTRAFDFASRRRGSVCIATHSYALRASRGMRQILEDFCSYALNRGAEPVGLHEFFARARGGVDGD